MFSVDDLIDLCIDAIMRRPEDPVAQPLFEAKVVGERQTVERGQSSNIGFGNVGAYQDFEVTGAGRYRITVEEVD